MSLRIDGEDLTMTGLTPWLKVVIYENGEKVGEETAGEDGILRIKLDTGKMTHIVSLGTTWEFPATTFRECALCWNREGKCRCSWSDWRTRCLLPKGQFCHNGEHLTIEAGENVVLGKCPRRTNDD